MEKLVFLTHLFVLSAGQNSLKCQLAIGAEKICGILSSVKDVEDRGKRRWKLLHPHLSRSEPRSRIGFQDCFPKKEMVTETDE